MTDSQRLDRIETLLIELHKFLYAQNTIFSSIISEIEFDPMNALFEQIEMDHRELKPMLSTTPVLD